MRAISLPDFPDSPMASVRRTGLIDTPHDAMLRGETLPNQIGGRIAKCGDEYELVVAARGHFPIRIVEQHRARLRRDELVRFLKDLAQDEIEINALTLQR